MNKPNFAGNVRKVLNRISGHEIENHIFSDSRKGYQRVKVWGFTANDLNQVENAMRMEFGDQLLSVENFTNITPWDERISLVVKIAK